MLYALSLYLPAGAPCHRRLAYGGSLFAPARFLDFARDDGARERSVWFIIIFCKHGHRLLARRGSLSAGRGRPAPTEAVLRPPKICRVQTKYLRADEGVRPYRSGVTPAKDLSYTSKLPTGGRGRPPLPALTIVTVVTRQPHYHNLFRPLKRCGVRDTAARR